MNKKEIIDKFKSWKLPVEDLEKLPDKIEDSDIANLPEETRLLVLSSELWDIRSIGPKLAVLLHQKGITRKNIMNHLPALPERAQMHLIYSPTTKIPHDLVPKIAAAFMLDEKETKDYEITGSYRRELPYSGDIDILYWRDWEALLEKLKTHGKNWIVYSRGTETITGIFIYDKKWTVQIDIWLATDADKHAMRLYTTGSKMFNIIMRNVAKKRGLKLNQHGVFDKKNKLIETHSEEDIFRVVGMKYLEPKQRSK